MKMSIKTLHEKRYKTTKNLKGKLIIKKKYFKDIDGVYQNFISFESHEYDPESVWTWSGGLELTIEKAREFIYCLESQEKNKSFFFDDYTVDIALSDREKYEYLLLDSPDKSMEICHDKNKTYLYFNAWYESGGTTMILTKDEVDILIDVIKKEIECLQDKTPAQ
ncbi:hypothetical protein P4637_03145 [Halalkalibacterium halodurans]|uniref:hypothetical protein n=1 Tax=Halalkalibacterium halodurans TaxID=86665 RepID=UPI002E1DB541|nr:hypothetical protein [Halalkalibacterium halodurans]MED4105496.1 hypothetical protein [Halalkalibacterium halodurans]MED4109298.1 hypothetical protein [Halalkalibacterium halodurans]MED4149688.1 hypothetical protein [Halalkalibacterium halodurans]